MTARTTTAPRRTQFATSDPGEARELIDSLFGGRLQLKASPDTRWEASVKMLDAGAFSISDVTVPADLTFDLAGQDDVLVSVVLAGAIGYDRGHELERYVPGDVFIANDPDTRAVADSHEARTLSVTLPRSLLTDVARGTPTTNEPWRFTATQATPGGAARWRHVARFVDDLLAGPETAASPLLLGPAGRLLAATAVTAFPHTLQPAQAPADRVDAHPGTLRRAVAYIEANPDLDLSVADIARAACVTPRAVQLAFRRHLGTTPTAYLRRARLAEAHRQLRDATSGDGVTVTAVAARWGFTPSRFTEHYRAAYGVLPSHTLRT
ncbi:helix-turn-helix transcriptional regulator [Geodermatophilus nigrescens]|uniref:Transcriptional regulator, AraC family n=1 Tax=Geodermatophilus nigrescens TaxID=1070870 RepID=A0A1M5HZJ7_9ACTN|nr:helix-turn-helix domain-containing protein [Geodermatophilus nigrescens]SHG21210.1 transcriptional regulator, AraC family [Geodermatophilus nigrescens]